MVSELAATTRANQIIDALKKSTGEIYDLSVSLSRLNISGQPSPHSSINSVIDPPKTIPTKSAPAVSALKASIDSVQSIKPQEVKEALGHFANRVKTARNVSKISNTNGWGGGIFTPEELEKIINELISKTGNQLRTYIQSLQGKYGENGKYKDQTNVIINYAIHFATPKQRDEIETNFIAIARTNNRLEPELTNAKFTHKVVNNTQTVELKTKELKPKVPTPIQYGSPLPARRDKDLSAIDPRNFMRSNRKGEKAR